MLFTIAESTAVGNYTDTKQFITVCYIKPETNRVWGGSPTSRFSDFGRRAKFEKHASVATLALLAV